VENSEKENGEENNEKEYSEKENSEWFKRCHYRNSIVSIVTDHSSTSTFYSASNKEKFLTLKIYIG
jgi:hypothetical protein